MNANAAYLGCLAVVGLINFLPLLGVLSAERITAGYGVEVATPDLELLLRHRALLFGIIGGFVFASLALPQLRSAAMVMAAVSMVGFLFLYVLTGASSGALRSVVIADLLGVVFLIGAGVLHLRLMQDGQV